MWNDSKSDEAARERLSALLDGELESASVVHVCGHWRENAESRATWHAYHLIGDVLRSDDLASHPVRDAGFLDALRVRLAEEPVVLAPRSPAQPIQVDAVPVSATRRRRAWLAPSAVAAGFVAVAGVLTLTRPSTVTDVPSTPLAIATVPAAGPQAAPALVSQITEPQTAVGERSGDSGCAPRSLPRGAPAVLRQFGARGACRLPPQRLRRNVGPLTRSCRTPLPIACCAPCRRWPWPARSARSRRRPGPRRPAAPIRSGRRCAPG